MDGTITRKILNKNFSLRIFDDSDRSNPILTDLTKEQLLEYVDRAKTYLIKERNAKPGQKVLMIVDFHPYYIIWFLAVSELGMSFLVTDFPAIGVSESVKNKLSLYGEIDHVIGRNNAEFLDRLPEYNDTRLCEQNVYERYFDTEYKDVFWATHQSILLYSTSSGSTNTPKVVTHTHGFFYILLERNAKLYQLKDSDYCFHSRGLHHGSVTGVYFLPTLKYCSRHLFAKNRPEKNADWIELLQKEQINRCILFYDMIDRFAAGITLENKKHSDMTIYVLSKVSNEAIYSLVKKFGYTISSIFGCVETSGPLFLPTITPNNFDTFNPAIMGSPLDDFYHISLNEQSLLEVKMPDGTTICTGDQFIIDNNTYKFEGRANLYRINDIPIYLDLLVEVVENFTKLKSTVDFDLVADFLAQKIYIRSNEDIDFWKINQEIYRVIGKTEYFISKKLISPREDLFTGIKFDAEEVRIRCRKI